MKRVCSFKEMWIDELFSFQDIARMHEMLDLEVYLELEADSGDPS